MKFILSFLFLIPSLMASIPSHLLQYEKNTITIFESQSSKVVNVSSLRNAKTSPFSSNITEIPAGSGSGFLWDALGHIVTNYHVIQGASKLRITFGDGTSYDAKIMGIDPRKDVCVLKIEKFDKKLQGIPLSKSDEIYVGQKAIAIGSPFGFDQTITVGTVSGVGRSILGIGKVTIRDMIQTDASINPGNSGGPLLDSRGFLVGMNTVIISKSGSSAGIGFALPVDMIERVVTQLIKYGVVKGVGLGVYTLNHDLTRQLRVEGVIIESVAPDKGAAKAGLLGTTRNAYGQIVLGDIIKAIDKNPIKNFDDLYSALEQRKVGEKVQVVVQRAKTLLTFIVELSEI